ncbi:MAG: 4-hydroxythreonine-4-phosphate dehydrogenase PdxA [Bacteroidales bacterium]|jgi:4-hydroxythreonine-4-phosphate dehydrogenase|nr:4-hydroxythreonine-4-phosphate dehydrogenase PdxA [Bacteroidales bacterium]
MSKKPVIGISQGDINGIGYEVIIKTLSDPRMLEMCTPVVYGSPKVAAYHRKALNMEAFNFNTVRQLRDADIHKANIINCTDDNVRVELGKITDFGGQASCSSLNAVVHDLKSGLLDALVTAPICKDNIRSDKFKFSGHTEFLAEQFRTDNYLMLMVSELLKIGVVTTHLPLERVPKAITKDIVGAKIATLADSLEQDFAIRKPRIAVLGLNPHAGEGGLLGTEEKNSIAPAIAAANERGILTFGPFPADGFFGSGDYAHYDGVLAMYHDQGMLPFKLLAFEDGVNYTAGLPIIRTSPAHGTAFDIAGEGKASPDSFRAAMYLAIDVAKNREIHREIHRNPLRKYEVNPNQVDESIDLTAVDDNYEL